jgi:hypothetical protein
MIRFPSVSRLVLLLIALLLLPHPASAACPTCYAWKPLRIGAGGWLTGLDIAPDGTKVVRTDTYGAYLWNAAAGEWQQLVTSTGMPLEDQFLNYDQTEGVWEIRIAPSDSRRLYMVWQGYFYRSADRGAHWTKTSFARRTDLDPNDGVRTSGQRMAVDPSNPDVVYVGTTSNGVWRTLDGGASWSQVSAITAGASPGHPGIVFDRASGTDGSGRTKTIYVPSYGSGVWRSLDAGATWTKTSGGPTNVWHAQIASDGIYYCATQGAVWKYAAGAWTRLEQSGPDWEVVVTDPANPARLIIADSGARVQMSLDRGATWNENYWVASGRTATDVPWLAWTKEDYLSNGDMRIDPTDGKLYFAEGIGVWQTAFPAVAEQPFTWSSQSKGIEQLVANWIWSVPGGSLFVTAWDRPVFRSTNPDVFPTTHGPNRTNSITYGASVEHAVNNPSFLAVDAGWQSEESSYSTDAGVTWTKFASYPPWGSPGLGHIAVSTDQNMVWIPNANKKGYYTKNRGASWTALPSPVNVAFDWSMYNNRHVITADRVTPNKFYLYDSNSGLYVSTTGGDSWTRVFTGHIVNSADGFNLKIKAVPGKAGHLFYTNGSYGGGDHVGPDSGELFRRSTDGGATWTTVPGVLEVYDFGFGKEAPGASYPTVFIAGFVNSVWGIWRSDDQGQTWVQVGERPLGSLDIVKAVDGDKNTYGTVYVGFMGSGYAYGGIGGTSSLPALAVTKAGTGAGTVTSSPAGINCGSTCSSTFSSGTLVTLSAVPAAGSSFAGWSGACSGTGACSVTLDSAKSVTATFTLNLVSYTLSIGKSGTGTGTVTSSPAGISCGASCGAAYGAGTLVSLSAVPATGSSFAGWSGACTGTGACSLPMDAAKSVTAAFTLNTVNYTLAVGKAGTGSGTVTSSPAGISCGASCSASFASGAAVTLTAGPATGSSFAGWSGACAGTSACSVTMSAARSVTATFNTASGTNTLTVAKTGDGSGTVTSTPAGISCGAACSYGFASGTVVSLSASQAAGSVFLGWSGACTGTGACTVTTSGSLAVTASFGLAMEMLTTSTTITGTAPLAATTASCGHVTSSPGGISCGSDCTELYNRGTAVTLTAAAASGYSFAGWTGDCTGSAATCQVTMNAVKNVAASFRSGSAPPPTGDFNRDGWTDLLWTNRTTGSLYSWFLKNGAMTSSAYFTPNGVADTSWQVVALGDLDLDTHTDLLWRNATTGTMGVWFMSETKMLRGVVLPTIPLPGTSAPSAWEIRGLADFNADRNPDILWRNTQTGDLYLTYLKGSTPIGGAYLSPQRPPSLAWRVGGVADMDGDGQPDIVMNNISTGELMVAIMKGNTAVRSAAITPARTTDTSWRLVGAADYNNDGKPDLFFENATTQEMQVWLMNGVARVSVLPISPSKPTSPDWRIVPR